MRNPREGGQAAFLKVTYRGQGGPRNLPLQQHARVHTAHIAQTDDTKPNRFFFHTGTR